jgi:hypothetical protein
MAVNRSLVRQVAQTLASRSRDKSRALPDSKGGEPAKQLKTYSTEVYSYFTVPTTESDLLYSAESWVKMKLTLETAGPVAVGTAANITPVLGGNGRLLDTSEEWEVILSKGTRIYVTSQTVNRLSVTIEPIPWLEQIDTDNVEGHKSVTTSVYDAGKAIVEAVNAMAGALITRSSSGKSVDDMPCPPPPARVIPRLTSARLFRKMR